MYKEKKWNDIDKEIKEANKILLNWALALPESNKFSNKIILDKKYVEEWLNKLKTYWFNKDIENAVSLFSQTSFYQETPFMEPYTTIEEIREEWQHVKNEDIHKTEINLLAIDNNVVIARWYLEQNNDIYDGIYEIRFNDKLECIYFRSWEMCK